MTIKSSREWVLELAARHGLLSENTQPFLNDTIDTIDRKLSLTMTRMSKRVLNIVTRSQRKEDTVHCLLREFAQKQRDFSVSDRLVSIFDNLSETNITQSKSLIKLPGGSVKEFFLLNQELCSLLISEAKRCAKNCGLKFGQISIEDLGLQPQITRFALRCILPALQIDGSKYDVDGSVIYDGDKPLFTDFTFTCDPSDDWQFSGSERSLPNHKDDSMITINFCLGQNFEGGSVLFEDIVEIEHQICRGIVHPGAIRHRVLPCRGQRFNLILFLNKKDKRHTHAPHVH